jgi:hypothetical protein
MPAGFEGYEMYFPVLVGAVIVFIVDLIGNMLSFSNRFLNALVTAIVFAVIFGLVIHLGFVSMTATTVPVAN